MKHHTCSSRSKGCPVLPIGLVNLSTGKNEMFGVVWDGWPESENSVNLLLRNSQGKYKAIASGGSGIGYDKGDTIELCHDQTNASMGTWIIIATFQHTKQGMIDMKTISGKSSLAFACFK